MTSSPARSADDDRVGAIESFASAGASEASGKLNLMTPPGTEADQTEAERAADTALARLDQIVATLRPYMGEAMIPTRQVVNPLLDVWDAAHVIDPVASSPVEHLLTALLSRYWVTQAELLSTLDEVRAAALQATVLSGALTTA